MANNGIKITKPIRQVGDIATVLGVSSKSERVLCTHSSVNKWSLAKPLPSPKMVIDRTQDRWFDGEKTGVYLTCGMTYGAVTSYPFNAADVSSADGKVALTGNGMFVQLANGTMGNWDYVKPNKTFRLSDFLEYVHNAVNPLPHVNSGVVYYTTAGAGQWQVTVPTQVDGGVTLSHLKNYDTRGTTFDDMYMGVFAFNDSLTDCIWATQREKFGQRLNNNVSFADTEGTSRCDITQKKGLYHCVTFFSSVPLSLCQMVFGTDTYCVPCNNIRYGIALLPQGTETIYATLNSFKTLSSSQYSIVGTASNWTTSAITISSVKFVAVDNLAQEEYTLRTNVTVPAFSEVNIGGDIKQLVGGSKGYIKMVVNGTTYTSNTVNKS